MHQQTATLTGFAKSTEPAQIELMLEALERDGQITVPETAIWARIAPQHPELFKVSEAGAIKKGSFAGRQIVRIERA